jgi:hypothetical protein
VSDDFHPFSTNTTIKKRTGHVVHANVATPLTTNFYLNTLKGETYGLSHTLARFKTG